MMRTGLELYQSQQQRIIMTPKLQQAINVLLMHRLELEQFMSQQLEQNPLLEEVQELEMDIEEIGDTDEVDPDLEWNEPEELLNRDDTEPDIDWENFFDDMAHPSERTTYEHPENEDQPQSDVAESQSLHDFLFAQLSVIPFSDLERQIGEQIIGNLNEDGQLKMPWFNIPLKFQEDLDNGKLSTSLRRELERKIGQELQLRQELQGFLFNTDMSQDMNLDGGQIPQTVFQAFDTNGYPLSQNAALTTKEREHKWLITDKENKQKFLLQKEYDQLEIYLQSHELVLSPKATITVEEPGHRWRIDDANSEQSYTVKKENDRLNVYNITLEDIAAAVGCDVEKVEEILRYIQENFEPTGIAYRTIPEALLIQMGAAEIEAPIAEAVIANHFDALLNNQIPQIAQELKIEPDEVLAVAELIGTLTLYPGRAFSDPASRYLRSNNSARYIIPEVTIENVEGEYQIAANDDGMPRLRLNPYYLNMMRNGHKALDGETKQWLEKRRSQAIDFLSSINERRKTITKVTEAIFEVQRDFLDEGVNGLKPLTLKQIAEMAGVHESTVSRVTTNKYVDTPQGIYKLKFFFSSDLNTDNGSNISATVVKEKIKEMVQNEDPAKPFSDQAISNALKSEGIQVARRTVQKYREELSIPSSSKRKRKW